MAGQGNTSKTCHTIVKRGAASIVTRLEARALTGDNLNVEIHQHHAHNVHVTWTIKFKNPDEPLVGRYFERWFNTPEECDAFREEVSQHPIQGKCSCVDCGVKPTLSKLIGREKLQQCWLFPVLTAGDFDQPGWKQKMMEDEGIIKCRCPVSSSERMFDTIF